MKKVLLLAALSVLFALSVNASDTILTKRASVVLISTVYDSIQFPDGCSLTDIKIHELLATGSTSDTIISHRVMTRVFPIKATDVYKVRIFVLSDDKREVTIAKEDKMTAKDQGWTLVMALLYSFLATMGLALYLDPGKKKNDRMFTYAFLALSSLGMFANIALIQYGNIAWNMFQLLPMFIFQASLALFFFAFRARMLPFFVGMFVATFYHGVLNAFLQSAENTGDYSLAWAYPITYVIFAAFIVVMIERKLRPKDKK